MKRTTKKRKYTRNIRKKGKRTRRYKKHTRRYKKRTRKYKKKGGGFFKRRAAVSSSPPLSPEEKYNRISKINPPKIVYPNFSGKFELGHDLKNLFLDLSEVEHDALQGEAFNLWKNAPSQSDTNKNRNDWNELHKDIKERWLVQALVGTVNNFEHIDYLNKKFYYTTEARKACNLNCYSNNKFCNTVTFSNDGKHTVVCGMCFDEFTSEADNKPCYQITKTAKSILKK
tara:strand:+ start:377 stop:1060 length:684 start_codon:yes stop_codon:yes gene_type:complete